VRGKGQGSAENASPGKREKKRKARGGHLKKKNKMTTSLYSLDLGRKRREKKETGGPKDIDEKRREIFPYLPRAVSWKKERKKGDGVGKRNGVWNHSAHFRAACTGGGERGKKVGLEEREEGDPFPQPAHGGGEKKKSVSHRKVRGGGRELVEHRSCPDREGKEKKNRGNVGVGERGEKGGKSVILPFFHHPGSRAF